MAEPTRSEKPQYDTRDELVYPLSVFRIPRALCFHDIWADFDMRRSPDSEEKINYVEHGRANEVNPHANLSAK
jgi:hypothetical protein